MSFVVHRVTKSAARYTDAGGREKCGYCRFFVAPRACGKVIGPVSPQGWCKYFSRQAVSLSGGGISGGGSSLPPGVTLDLNFMNPGTLDPRITFTRASTAAYIDASGVIQMAATNAPRWDYDPVTHQLRGVLIEEQRTNIALNSGDLSNASTGGGSVGAAAPTRTGNNVIAPDGTMTGTRAVYPAVSSAGQASSMQLSFNMTVAPYTMSVWLRGNVGGETLYLCTTPDGVLYYRQQYVLTTAWQRYTLTTPNLTTAGWFWQIGTDRRDASQVATPAQTIYAWGAQVEQGAFPTSYIPTTTAAVSRARDVTQIPPNVSWYTAPGGSWFAEFICNNNPTTGLAIRVLANSLNNGLTQMFVNGNAGRAIGMYDGVAELDTANGITIGAISKAATTWATGQAKACANGGAVATLATLTNGYPLDAAGILILVSAALSDSMTGYIRRVNYWPRALSNAEMQQVTT